MLLRTAARAVPAAFGVLAVVAATVAAGLAPAATPARAVQSIPYLINFQGRLTDNNGNALSDGSYNVKFRIWSAGTSGTNLWEGDRVMGATDHRITVQNGLFNIQFGDTTAGDPALSPSLFNTQTNPTLYLEVELPTPATATCATNGCASFTEGAMTPRQPLASSPYAYNSDTLDGLDSTAFGQLSAANTFTGVNTFAATSGISLTVKAAAATHALDIKDSSSVTQAYFDANGIFNVGQTIQTTTSTVDLGTAGSTFRTGYFGTSLVSPALNATSSGGTITTNAGTLQRTAAGTTTIDLKDAGTTTLAVTNSGGGVAGISASGGLTIGTGKVITVGASTGSALTCASGQIIDGAVITGGVVTGGTCVAAGGGDRLAGTWTSQQATTTTNTQTTVQFTGGANSAPSFNNTTHVLTLPSNASKLVVEAKAGGGGGGGTGTTNVTNKMAGGGAEGGYGRTTITNVATSCGGSSCYFKLGGGGAGGATTPTAGTVGSSTCFGANAADACTTPLASGTGGAGGASSNVACINQVPASGGSGTGDTSQPGGNALINGCTTATGVTLYSSAGGGAGGAKPLTAALANGGTANASTANSGGGGGGGWTTGTNGSNGSAGSAGYITISVYTTVAGTGNPATLQSAYDNATDPEITLSSSGLTVRDSSAGLGTNLFEVQNNAGTTDYLAVTASGVTASGTVDASGFKVSGTAGSSATCTGNQVLQNPTLVNGILTAGTCGNGPGANTALSNLTATSINADLTPSTNNTFDLGTPSNIWTHLYANNVDAGTTTTTLTIGTAATTTAVTIGRSGLAVSLPGGLTTSGGAINTGTGAITSTGTITGNLFSGSGASLTSLNPTNLVQGTGAVSLQSANATALTVDSGTTGTVNVGTDTASAKTINVGPTATNVNTTVLNLGINTAGTQDINLGSNGSGNAAAGTTISIQGGTTANTAVVIGTNGAGGITMDTGTTGSVLIGTGTTSAKTITLGPAATNTNTTTLNLGINTAGTQDINIGSTGSGNAAAGTTVDIQGGTTVGTAVMIGTNGAGGITIDSGTTGGINIGNGTTGSKTITIGPNATNTSLTALNIGVNTAGTQQIRLGSNVNGGAAAGTTLNLQGGTTAGTAVLIGTNGAGGITIDSGTTGSINIGNNANGKIVTIGNTSTGTAVNISAGTGGINVGDDATTKEIDIAGVSNDGTDTVKIATNGTANADNITIGNAAAGTALTLDAGVTGKLQLGNSASAHAIQIGNGGVAAGNAQNIDIGSPTTSTASLVALNAGNITTTNGNSGIVISGGFSTTDTNLVGLTLDSSSTFTETAGTCSATVNGGTMYFNTSTNAVRTCVRDPINATGSWEDLPSTAGLGAILFGVVPDSGLSANQGDWAGIGGANVGPCKVSRASATQVSVAPCNAYSAGRKVVVASATTITLPAMTTAPQWVHICFTAAGAIATSAAGAELANLPSFSANNPLLCLADVVNSTATANTIGKIYDVRTFTTTQKEFVTNQTTAAGLGQVVSTMAATNSVTQAPTTSNTSILRGVVVATTGTTSTTSITAVIATRGPQWVKFSAATGTINQYLEPVTGGTAGYMSASTTASTITYGTLGLQLRVSDNATCSANTNCQMSVPTDINLR